MALVRIPNAGSVGVIKDLSQHELPPNAWTDASNIRFLDGYCRQFFGHGPMYGTPSVTPYHVVPVISGSTRYWLYAGAAKIYAATITGGVAVHTNLTRQTAGADVNYSGTQNAWTSTTLSGIPILNPGNITDPPQRWNLDIAGKFVALDNWPANTYCKVMRAYKNFLVALNVTKAGTNYGFMVKWSHPADPGSVPASWDPADATKDAGEIDLAEGGDAIVDGLQLRDSFMIYKESSVWRMDFIGGSYVMRFQKVLGVSGAMNRNCIVEIDGLHFVLTGSDVVVHDGQSATSILDKQARRALFQDMDTSYTDRAFVFKNPFMNEVFVCYASIGSSVPDKALVWNYKDRTVSYRTIPNLNHANYGTVDNTLNGSYDSDSDPVDSDLTLYNGPDFTPNAAKVLMASADAKLYMLDSSASFDGAMPAAYLERRGLSFGEPESIKVVRGIRPRIVGSTGQTVSVQIGASDDPFTDPVYGATMTHTIGSTISNDCFVSGRYIAVRFSTGTGYQWRLDSYDLDVVTGGKW
jgi:hypothetical protein